VPIQHPGQLSGGLPLFELPPNLPMRSRAAIAALQHIFVDFLMAQTNCHLCDL
jgi:hypothetical protein